MSDGRAAPPLTCPPQKWVVRSTPSQRRRLACLIGTAVINAALLLLLRNGLRPGGDGLPSDDAVEAVFIAAPTMMSVRKAEVPVPGSPLAVQPQRPSPILGDEILPERAGPPTETPQSVRRRMVASQPTRDDDQLVYECASVPPSVVMRDTVVAVLALRIGIDGRVADVEIDRSSGRAALDRSLAQCARSWGPFPVAIIDGRVVESWRSIAWPEWVMPSLERDPSASP